MNLLFKMDDQVHQFSVHGEIHPSDLLLLRQSLFRFFEGNPPHTVLDLSDARFQVPDFEVQSVLNELKIAARSKGLEFASAQTDIECLTAKQQVLEGALLRQVEILRSRIALREDLESKMKDLLGQNQELKKTLDSRLSEIRTGKKKSPLLDPLIERLWSEK